MTTRLPEGVILSTRESLRDAAILLESLEPAAAERLLDQLGPEAAARLRSAAAALTNVDSEQRCRVLQAFMQQSGTSQSLQQLAAESCQELAEILDRERPQVAAVVIDSLPPDLAGQVIQRLSRHSRGDILARVSSLEIPEAEVLQVVSDEIQDSLAAFRARQAQRAAGQSAVRAILRSLPGADNWLAETSAPADAPRRDAGAPADDRREPSEGASSREEVLRFERLADFSDDVLAAILKVAGEQTVCVAMMGADRELSRRIGRLLPAASEASWRGPVPLSDIERAQRRLAACAEQLLQGERPDPSKRFTAAA